MTAGRPEEAPEGAGDTAGADEGTHPFTHLDPRSPDSGWWSWILDLDPFSPTVGRTDPDPAPSPDQE